MKIDFKKFFISLSKSIIMFSAAAKTGGIVGKIGAMKEVPDIISSVELKKDTSGTAYLLLLKAMVNASHDLIQENLSLLADFFKDENELINDREYSNFLDSLNDILEGQELFIDIEIIKNPRKLSFLPKFCEQFCNWLIYYKIDKNAALSISSRLPAYFVLSLNEEWKNSPEQYFQIIQKLDTPISEAAKEEIIWQGYKDFLNQQIDKPVFSEPFSLRQIYVPLRAYYNAIKNENERQDKNDIVHGKNNYRKPLDLKVELSSWLDTINSRDTIRFLSGGPGSGKSSFAKIWAAEIANNTDKKILFIPLHLFDIQGDLMKSISDFIKLSPELGNVNNPLESLTQRTLIIFDGLDELSQQGRYALEVARQFIDNVIHINNMLNRDNAIRVLFLITGRDVSIQNNTSKFKLDKQILHLLPYFVKEKDEWAQSLPDIEKALILEDQRDAWWSKYGELIGETYTGMPEELKLERLDEITSQPLLNYLVALSLRRGKIILTKNTNLNDIYADLIEGVHERAYEQHRKFGPIEELDLKDFKRILEEIALSAWHGGDVRTTSVKKIERHMENNNLKPLLDRFKTEAEKGIIQLLTAFYFRQHGMVEGEQTFEFTHKSFGEYLTATRLVSKVSQIHNQLEARVANYDEGWDEEKALEAWLEAAGDTAIDEYLRSYILDEVSKREDDKVENWQDTLAHLIRWSMYHGMPTLKERKSNKKENVITRNASEALMVLHFACANKTHRISSITLERNTTFGAWIRNINSQRRGSANSILYKSLAYIDCKNSILYAQDFYNANMSHVNLESSLLSYSFMMLVNLNHSNLSFSSVEQSNLQSGRLSFSNFSFSDLSDSTLSRSTARSAKFISADLTNVDFSYADLTSADFSHANLTGAKFNFAVLKDTKFDGAYMSDTDLRDVRELQFEQLSVADTLYKAKFSHSKLRKRLEDSISDLFVAISIQEISKKFRHVADMNVHQLHEVKSNA